MENISKTILGSENVWQGEAEGEQHVQVQNRQTFNSQHHDPFYEEDCALQSQVSFVTDSENQFVPEKKGSCHLLILFTVHWMPLFFHRMSYHCIKPRDLFVSKRSHIILSCRSIKTETESASSVHVLTGLLHLSLKLWWHNCALIQKSWGLKLANHKNSYSKMTKHLLWMAIALLILTSAWHGTEPWQIH